MVSHESMVVSFVETVLDCSFGLFSSSVALATSEEYANLALTGHDQQNPGYLLT
jgi:hypothetical protein